MFLTEMLVKREKEGFLRKLPKKENLIDFSSNDYLGFSSSFELMELFHKEFSQIKKIGSTGSRLLTGNSDYAELIEEEIAKYHRAESALLFSSGYAANLALISSLAQRDDTIFFDEEVHASVRDGITLSRARHYSFRHNDLDHLEKCLLKAKRRIFVCIESLYSIDGSFSPLEEMYHLCNKYRAHLIVDEAHATGIFDFEKKGFAHVHTFGKALGVQGGVVLGSYELKNYLINFARAFVYSTAISFLNLSAIRSAYKLLQTRKESVKQLHALIHYFGRKSPIIALKTKEAKSLWKKLKKEGFNTSYLRHPTVKEDTLRISLHAFNSENEIDQLKLLCAPLL